MNHPVDSDDLTDAEAASVAQAIDIYRAAPTALSFFHTVPMRDATGRLCEVRFFANGDSQQPLAVIRIADGGALAPLQQLP